MRLRVKTLTRRTFGLDVHPSASIDELKARLTQETGIPLAGQKLVYKGEVLQDGCVQDCGIVEDDFLVVVVVRPPASAGALSSDSVRAEGAVHARTQQPDMSAIGSGLSRPGPQHAADLCNVESVPVQLSELIHALSSFSPGPNAGLQLPPQLNPLLSNSSRSPRPEEEDDVGLQEDEEEHMDADDGEEDEEDEEDDGEDEDEEREHDEDDVDEYHWENPEALQQLIDMGFPENRARKALQINRGDAQLGMDWLLEHEGDADIDEPLSDEDLRMLARQARHEQGETLDQAAVQRLIEMGFSEDDIFVALDHCENDFEAATAWLLGDRGDGGLEDDPEMFGGGAGISLLDSLMNEPHLQQALSNPRIVTALQGILGERNPRGE